MRPRTLPPSLALWVVAGVLLLSLWASGAPAMIYPVFAATWGVGPIVTTALFAVYPVALVVVMVMGGSLSDRYGRRRLLVVGVGAIAGGTALFAVADPIPLVFAGRIMQGAGVGLAMSAASAALIEFTPNANPNRASAVNTAATAVGAAAAILVGGLLVEFTSDPTHLAFWVLLAAVVFLFVMLFFLPEQQKPVRTRHKRALLTIPTAHRRSFLLGTGAVTVAFITGAVFLALGAQIIRDLVGTTNAFLAAATLATWPLIIVPTTVAARRLTTTAAATIGGFTAAAGLALLLLSSTANSLALFLVAAIVAGIGYGLMVYGGLGLVTTAATTGERAGTFSAMYLSAYLAQGTSAVIIGSLATSIGLNTAVLSATPVIALLCISIGVTALRATSG